MILDIKHQKQKITHWIVSLRGAVTYNSQSGLSILNSNDRRGALFGVALIFPASSLLRAYLGAALIWVRRLFEYLRYVNNLNVHLPEKQQL